MLWITLAEFYSFFSSSCTVPLLFEHTDTLLVSRASVSVGAERRRASVKVLFSRIFVSNVTYIRRSTTLHGSLNVWGYSGFNCTERHSPAHPVSSCQRHAEKTSSPCPRCSVIQRDLTGDLKETQTRSIIITRNKLIHYINMLTTSQTFSFLQEELFTRCCSAFRGRIVAEQRLGHVIEILRQRSMEG